MGVSAGIKRVRTARRLKAQWQETQSGGHEHSTCMSCGAGASVGLGANTAVAEDAVMGPVAAAQLAKLYKGENGRVHDYKQKRLSAASSSASSSSCARVDEVSRVVHVDQVLVDPTPGDLLLDQKSERNKP